MDGKMQLKVHLVLTKRMLLKKHVVVSEFSGAIKKLELENNFHKVRKEKRFTYTLQNISMVNPKRVINEFVSETAAIRD